MNHSLSCRALTPRRPGFGRLLAACAVVAMGAVGDYADGRIFVRQARADEPELTSRTRAPEVARALSQGFATAAKAINPSVVRLDIEVRPESGGRNAQRRRGFQDFFEFFERGMPRGAPRRGQGRPMRSMGSGFLWDDKGHIVTNNHVIRNANKVTVTFPGGEEIPAEVVGRDDQTDVGVVKLTKLPKGMRVARLGNSDQVQVGEWVLAVGSPLGMAQTVTAGIISGKGRNNGMVPRTGERVRDYLQTDAVINRGNSGGPLVNLEGEVIGVNTMISFAEGGGYGFSIPINEVRRVAQTIIKEGRMRYAYLGVSIVDVETARKSGRTEVPGNAPDGALVATVSPGAPADKAGMRPKDIILRIDGQKIEGAQDVVNYIASRKIGSTVNVAYWRNGKKWLQPGGTR